jgi:hypothetical protein
MMYLSSPLPGQCTSANYLCTSAWSHIAARDVYWPAGQCERAVRLHHDSISTLMFTLRPSSGAASVAWQQTVQGCHGDW